MLDQQIVEVLAKSMLTYWKHGNRDHNMESVRLPQEMIQSLLKEIRRRRGMPDEQTISDAEILQMAREKATQIWQEKSRQPGVALETHHLNVTKSVSLFPTPGGSALDNFLTFELIRERAQDSHGILEMLSKIQYLDDLIPDWDDIALFLRSELSSWFSKAKSTETAPSVGSEFISLHRQWFDMTRKGIHSSQDYRMIQISLVQSLIEAVHCVDKMQEEDRHRHLDFYKKCLCTILDMFCDWMDRNIGGYSDHDPSIRQIGVVLWDWSTTMATSVYVRSNILRQHCPYGQWIYQWFAQCFMVGELVALLERSTMELNGLNKSGKPGNALFCLVHEASALIDVIRKSDCEHAPNEDTTSINISSPNIEIDGVNAVRTIVWILSTIRSILCVTRVSHFPWYLLKYSTSCDPCERLTVDPHEYQLQLWEMFWQLFCWIHHTRVPAMGSPLDINVDCVIFTDGMEVLLLGVSSSTQSTIISNIFDGNKLGWLQRFKQRNCDL
jgi:hypothetical protein